MKKTGGADRRAFAKMETASRAKTLSNKWPAVYRDRPRDSQSKNRGGIPKK
jgi:hypothetical protein